MLTDIELDSPPVVPDADERPVVDGQAFAAECIESLKALPVAKPWTLGRQLVTESDRWGTVWRADVEVGELLVPLVNRLVIWRAKDGSLPLVVAIGQQIEPL